MTRNWHIFAYISTDKSASCSNASNLKVQPNLEGNVAASIPMVSGAGWFSLSLVSLRCYLIIQLVEVTPPPAADIGHLFPAFD
eukprot:scaffold16219_cov97-Skeletonema_dohrnii-CCMP3373.AAC.2